MNYYSDSIGTWSKCIIKCVFIDPRHVCRNLFLKMNILNFSKTLEKRDDKNTVNFNSSHATRMQNLSVLWLFGPFHYESLPFPKIIPQLTLRPAELGWGSASEWQTPTFSLHWTKQLHGHHVKMIRKCCFSSYLLDFWNFFLK